MRQKGDIMQRFLFSVLPWVNLCLWTALVAHTFPAVAADSERIKADFANPPRQFSSGPLWVWNDMLTEDQIRSTLRDLASQKVQQVWVHPRPGLMTPYLGKDWFRLWRVALVEAERLDMNVWIYDENSYPSGFAGGIVSEAMPQARGQGLHVAQTEMPPAPADNMIAAYRITDDGAQNVTTEIREPARLPKGRYLSYTRRWAPSNGWFGGKFYVDMLHPGVTEKFIEVTLDAYRRELGEHFGQRIPGWFTDEPHLTPAGGLHWSEHLPDAFRERWGYDLMNHLPSLTHPIGDWKRVRHNYWQLLLEQFIDRWAKPCYEYCEQHHLEFTGHYWEHGWPGASHGSDNMAMYAWHQRPAIDNLMNEYTEGVNGQFGNARTVKELSSVANQLGRKRTLCEAYGAGGWDLRLEDMKRIGDWLYVLGVNTLNEHLSYITIRGARKRDHPQSFSYHTPWWEAYHKMAVYFRRLSLVLSEGKQVNHVLLLQPTSSAWMYQPDASTRGGLAEIGNSFQQMINDLEQAQAEYDIGSEDILARRGRTVVSRTAGRPATRLVVGCREYDMVVLPPQTENLNATTVRLLTEYLDGGGTILCCGPPPARVDGQLSPQGQRLAGMPSWRQLDAGQAIQAMRQRSEDGLAIRRAAEDQGLLFHHRRRLDDGQFVFLVNTSIEHASSGTVQAHARGVQRWDLESGSVAPYPFVGRDQSIQTKFTLPPCGSLLLLFSDRATEPVETQSTEPEIIRSRVAPVVRRLQPNVLTLDYVDVSVGEEQQEGVHFYRAQQLVFNQHGLASNPWDSAVQFRDELITKQFPPDSGFEATYRFTINERVPEPIHIVIERADLYTIHCNGKLVRPDEGAWWLDKSFGKVDLTSAARIGENTVTIQASPMTMYHELESAYVLGDFSLEPAESGFTIVPSDGMVWPPDAASRGAGPKGWNQQGLPFYSSGVSYTQNFDVPTPSGTYSVSLSRWYGSVAKVQVNGQVAGYIAYQPWTCDVTPWIKPGPNTVEVIVIGTLRNTLGPHHYRPPAVGKAWPHMFRVAPDTGPPSGTEYHTLSYGLFEPFVLLHGDRS